MKAVVLLSGGLDSTVCLALALEAKRECVAMFVDYGQAAEFTECFAAKRIAADAEVKIVSARVRAGFDSGLHDTKPLEYGRDISEIGQKGDRPSSYVPARNLLLLSLALGLAETIGAEEIWMGANAGDAEGYPDCRPSFIRAFEAVSQRATRGPGVRVWTPLIGHNKAEIVQLARDLNVNIDRTSSCYRGIDCGSCDACVLRKHALEIK